MRQNRQIEKMMTALVAILSFSQAANAAVEAAKTTSDQLKEAAAENTLALERRRLSLSACFNQADADNKEILVASASLPISQAAIVIAKAIPNPTYSMIYGFGPAWQYIVAGNNQQVGWSEEIQVAGRRTKKEGVARANYLQTAFQVEAVRFDVHNRVRRAYAELAAAAAYLDLIESQRAIGQKLLDIAQKRFEAGKIPGAQVVQAKLAVMQFDTLSNQAMGRLTQDSTRLAQLLGETPHTEEIIDADETGIFKLTAEKSSIVPDPGRATPALQELLPAAWRQRNDLKALIEQAYSARKAVTLAKTERIPDPVAGFNYMFSTYKSYQPIYFDPTGTGLNTPANQVPFQPGYLFTVSEETPIFYQYQGQVNQAKATWAQNLKQSDQLKSQIATDIVTAYEAVAVSRENIGKFQQDLLPAALNVARLSRRGYELGKIDLATAMLAQQQYQQLRSSYFDSIVSYQNAWADLERAVGVTLTL